MFPVNQMKQMQLHFETQTATACYMLSELLRIHICWLSEAGILRKHPIHANSSYAFVHIYSQLKYAA